MNTPDKTPMRSRREWEDTLLYARTGIFLAFNGLVAQIEKLSQPIAIAMAIVNCLWVLASLQSWKVISNLARHGPPDIGQQMVNRVLGITVLHHLFRPTTLVSVWVPILVYCGWLLYIVYKQMPSQIYIVYQQMRSQISLVVLLAAFLLPFAILLLLHVTRNIHQGHNHGVQRDAGTAGTPDA